MRVKFFALVVAGTVFAGCGSEPEAPVSEPMPDAADAESPGPAMLPDVIVAERGGFIPEAWTTT